MTKTGRPNLRHRTEDARTIDDPENLSMNTFLILLLMINADVRHPPKRERVITVRVADLV